MELAITRFNNDERVAFARILFSNEAVHHWQMAVWPGQQPLPVDGKDYYGYGVDAGMGLLMDERAAQALEKRLDQSQDAWEQIFTSSFDFDSSTPRKGFLYRIEVKPLLLSNRALAMGLMLPTLVLTNQGSHAACSLIFRLSIGRRTNFSVAIYPT